MSERFCELQKRRKNGESPEGGFTLIELLIVIVVLGILAAIVIFSLTGVTGQSAQAACNTDAKSVQTAVQAYESNPPTGVAAGTAPRVDQPPGAQLPARRTYGDHGVPGLRRQH